MHVHVHRADGEAKFWLDPELGLAQNYGLNARHLTAALRLIRRNEDQIRAAWKTHFAG